MVRESLRTSGQRAIWCQGAGHAIILGKSILGRGNRMCNSPEAEMSSVRLRNRGNIIVARAEQGQSVRESGRGQAGARS